MRQNDIFRNYEYDASSEKWNPFAIKECVVALCNIAGKPIPSEARELMVRVNLPRVLKVYLRQGIEDQDFVHLFKSAIGDDVGQRERALGVVAVSAPSLASFTSECFGMGAEFVPQCMLPFIGKLHSLPVSGEVVFKDLSQIGNFKTHLLCSRHYALDFHNVKEMDSGKEHLAMVTFCFRAKVFFLFPSLFPETVQLVVEAKQCLVFLFCWIEKERHCLEALGWMPNHRRGCCERGLNQNYYQ